MYVGGVTKTWTTNKTSCVHIAHNNTFDTPIEGFVKFLELPINKTGIKSILNALSFLADRYPITYSLEDSVYYRTYTLQAVSRYANSATQPYPKCHSTNQLTKLNTKIIQNRPKSKFIFVFSPKWCILHFRLVTH